MDGLARVWYQNFLTGDSIMTILQVVFLIGAVMQLVATKGLDYEKGKTEILQRFIIAMLFGLSFRLESMK